MLGQYSLGSCFSRKVSWTSLQRNTNGDIFIFTFIFKLNCINKTAFSQWKNIEKKCQEQRRL